MTIVKVMNTRPDGKFMYSKIMDLHKKVGGNLGTLLSDLNVEWSSLTRWRENDHNPSFDKYIEVMSKMQKIEDRFNRKCLRVVEDLKKNGQLISTQSGTYRYRPTRSIPAERQETRRQTG